MLLRRTMHLPSASLLICLFLQGATLAQATGYYVGTHGSDSNPGSMNQPFLTVQHALDVAQTGDTVSVFPGTYRGKGDRDLDFAGKSLSLIGLGSNPSNLVILDCQHAGRGFHFHRSESPATLVEGFTILAAHAPDGVINAASGLNGGGVLIEGGSSPTIENCTFSADSAGNGIDDQQYVSPAGNGGNGGAIYIQSGNPVIQNCVFRSNQAGSGATYQNFHEGPAGAGGNGGAILVAGGGPQILGCRFAVNQAGPGGSLNSGYNHGNGGDGGSGGAVSIEGGYPIVAECAFSHNAAAPGGAAGGIGTSGGTGGSGGAMQISTLRMIQIMNCRFIANQAGNGGSAERFALAGNGGGLEIDGSPCVLTGCVFTGNLSGEPYAFIPGSPPGGSGGGINAVGSQLTLTDCDLTDNQAGPGTGGDGGGMAISGGDAQIVRCRFLSNYGGSGQGNNGNPHGGAENGGSGGGLFVSDASLTLSECLLLLNRAGDGGYGTNNTAGNGGDGGGVALLGNSALIMTNCLLLSNTTGGGGGVFSGGGANGGNGGGMSIDTTSSSLLLNCSFAYNTTGVGGTGDQSGSIGIGGGLNIQNGTVALTNSILYFDTDASGASSEIVGSANVSYSDVQATSSDLGNPRFRGKSKTDPDALQLLPRSPCIDVGNNAAWKGHLTDLTDLAGNPRIVNGIVDLGAYEYQRLKDVTTQVDIQLGSVTHTPGTSIYTQPVTLTNIGKSAIAGPICLVLESLSSDAQLRNLSGVTVNITPPGTPYIQAKVLNVSPGATVKVTLKFDDPSGGVITYTPHVASGGRP